MVCCVYRVTEGGMTRQMCRQIPFSLLFIASKSLLLRSWLPTAVGNPQGIPKKFNGL